MATLPPPVTWLPHLLLWLGGACALSAGLAATFALTGAGAAPLWAVVVPPLLVLLGFFAWVARTALEDRA